MFRKWKPTKKVVSWLEKKVDNKRSQIDKYGYLGLILFVGIPLPGTGAWTGTLLAIMLGLNKKKSFYLYCDRCTFSFYYYEYCFLWNSW